MNRIIGKIVLLLACVSILSFVSCNSDNRVYDEGFFSVDGEVFNLNRAILEEVGTAGDFYQLRLSFDNTSNNDLHKLNFLLYSEVTSYLPSAEYTPYLLDENYLDKFARGAWMIGDVEQGLIKVGKLKSTKQNDIYTIHIDCVDINGKIIIGEYKGRIQIL